MCSVLYLNSTIDLYVKTTSEASHTTLNCDLPLQIGTQKKCTSSNINASQMLCAAQRDDIAGSFEILNYQDWTCLCWMIVYDLCMNVCMYALYVTSCSMNCNHYYRCDK